jgi:hypothetical protein
MIQAGGPPNTALYYHIAYAWVAIAYAGYAAIVWLRRRRVRRRLAEVSAREPWAARDA